MADIEEQSYWFAHKEARQESNRAQYEKNRDKRLAYQRQYRERNKEKCALAVSAWKEKNGDRLRRWHVAHRKEKSKDPYNRLYKNVARRMLIALKAKSAKTNELIGCTPEFLRNWLEEQFVDGMSWENYGPIWHVDHKKPLALFDLIDPIQQREACNYRNLQPLFAKENIAKGKRYNEETQYGGK